MMFDTCTIVPALLHVLVLGLFAVFVTFLPNPEPIELPLNSVKLQWGLFSVHGYLSGYVGQVLITV